MVEDIDASGMRARGTHISLKVAQGKSLTPIEDGLHRGVAKFSRQRFKEMQSTLSGDSNLIGSGVTLPVTAIFIRPVGDACNLGCTYCYQADLRGSTPSKKMSLDTLRNVLKSASQLEHRPISFAWHGGEPLLAGKDFFRSAITMLNELFPRTGEILNSVQTSGVLLDEEWLEIFKDGNFAIGFSLDGPQAIHDYYRKSKSGAGTYQPVVKNIEMAHRNGILVNAICVVSSKHENLGSEVFDTFTSLNIRHCNFQPEFGGQELGRSLHVKPEIFSSFAIQFWDRWKTSSPPYMRVRFFDNFFSNLVGAQGEDCVFSGECSRLVAVSVDGSIRPCSRPIKGYEKIGNFSDIANFGVLTDRAATFRTEDLSAQRDSRGCKYFDICHQGCPQHRLDMAGSQAVDGANVFCGCRNGQSIGYNTIWDYMLKDIISIK